MIGFVIDPKYKNKGYATEVLRKSIEVLFNLGFLVIRTGVFKENTPSMKVSEKVNMTRLDKTTTIEYKGITHTCIWYEIRKDR
ncbi:MAG: GNAT family N-acetyltransferase [Bacilli bacterium]|nr:GNAT family N-acetyltransferase [Bacilli bacterium]